MHQSKMPRAEQVTTSRWITDTLPDSDMTVLIRCSGEEYPVWPGFHDGEQWCSADGSTLEGPVLGWMELETAVEVLDGNAPDQRPGE